MKKIYFFLGMVFAANMAFGQIYLNSFTGASACPTNGNIPAMAANSTGTAVTRSTVTCTATLNVFNSSTLNNTAAVVNTSYIEFTATANAGYQLNLTTLSFFRQGSNTAPNQVEVRYSTDGFATSTSWGAAPLTPTAGSVTTWDFADFSSANGGTVAFRIYPYGTQRCDLTAPAASTAGTFRVDDVTINGTVTSASSPAITVTPGSLTGFTSLSGVPSAEQSYAVDGANLTANIIITPPVGFEITTTSGSGYVANPSFITLTQSGGVVASTPIYVRMNSATLGTNSGSITNTSTGANNPGVSLTGHVITTEPTVQSAITFGTITSTSIVVNFAGGNGAKRVLLARLGSAVNSDPVDGTTYTPNAIFGSGTQIGVGNYVVYANTGNTVTVTGLNPSLTYYFAVYEYNDAGIAGAENYLLTAPGTGNATTASTDGDYRSVATGNWSDITIWQVRAANLWIPAVLVPNSTSNVYIQTGHTVTVDIATATCNDLHINSATAVLAIGANTVEVNGKLRAYTGAAVTSLGADATFYSAQASTTTVGATCISSTAGSGKLRFVGTTRIITNLGEWGNNPPLWDVEFAPNAGQTLTIQTGFKAANITTVSGTTLSTNTDMRPDGSASGTGTLTVKAGSSLQFSNNSITIQRVGAASATSHFGTLTVEAGAVLEFSGTSSPIIGTAAFALNGTVIYSGAGAQTFISKGSNSGGADAAVYNNVTLSTSGTKTSGSFTTTINGTLSLQGTAILVAPATFAYGPVGVLEYKGSAAQATGGPSPSEWPIANGPYGLTIDNINGVTLSAATGNRTINGALTLTNGILTTTTSSVLVLGNTATVPTTPNNANFVSGPVEKIGNTAFTFPIGKTGTGYVPIAVSNFTGTLDPVNDAFTAEYVRSSAAALGPVTDPFTNHVSTCDYWKLDRTSGAQTTDVTATWNSNNPCNGNAYITNLAQLLLGHFNGVSWNSSSWGFSSTTGTTASGTITWSGVSTYSPFALGSHSNANPLPINVNYLNGYKQAGTHKLNWSVTCVTTPRVTMTLERSSNGTDYTGIYSITADAVRCAQPFDYTDAQPLPGMNFYRLKMVDIDGKISYSTTVALLNATKGYEIVNMVPNPVSNTGICKLNVSSAQVTRMDIIIADMQGRVVSRQGLSLVAGFNSIDMDLSQLASGTYTISGIAADGTNRMIRFVKQ